MCWREKKSGTKEASEREPSARLGSFLHPPRLQLPMLIFYLSAIWWHVRPTDRPGGMHAWMDAVESFFGRTGDVEMSSR